MPDSALKIAQDRREEIKHQLAAGADIEQLAKQYGVTIRAIQRDKERLGLTRKLAHQWTEEQLRLAEMLLDDGCPYTEVGRTLGVSEFVVKHKFPGRGNRAPVLGNGHLLAAADALGLRLT